MKLVEFPQSPLADAEWSDVAKEKVVSGSPKSAYKVLYTSKSEELYSGIYECTAGKWKVTYAEDEFCTLLEGRLRMTSDTGEVQEFRAPDSFLIPSGYSGFWEPLEKLRKFFVIYEKAK